MKDEILYQILRALFLLIGLIPRKISRFMADVLGLLWYDLDARHRAIALDNVEKALGDDLTQSEQQHLTKRVFKNIALILFELGWAMHLKTRDLPRYFSLKGLDNLEKACAKGNGALLLLCHIGNWELLVGGIALTGFRSSALYRKLDFLPLERLIRELREKHGTRMIPLRGASRKLDALLASGEVVGTLLDQNVDWYKGVFVSFFGRPACTNRGVAELVMRTRTPVVPTFIIRKGGKHLMAFQPEIPLVDTGDRIRDIETNTQNYVCAIETMVRRYPEQWFWVHNRWKTKPYCLLSSKKGD